MGQSVWRKGERLESWDIGLLMITGFIVPSLNEFKEREDKDLNPKGMDQLLLGFALDRSVHLDIGFKA